MNRARSLCLAVVCIIAGCASAPKSVAQRNSLIDEAHNTIATMTASDSSLQPLLDQSVGYVVFPDVKQGGFIVGGSGGKGVVFQNGQPIGFAELSQGSVGLQAGGQAFSELIVLKDQAALDRIKDSQFAAGAQASAVAVKAGAASSARFESGSAVFVKTKGGAMLNLSLTGQRIKFVM